MARFSAGGAAGRLAKKISGTDWSEKAKQAAQTLRDEYAAGTRGDDSEPTQLWASPREQFAHLVALVRSTPSDAAADAEASEVAAALGSIDWSRVRAATAERTGDATETVKSMAQQVDWAKVQPVAAQVSSALIAAVASGQLGLGGRLGPTVARAIINQDGLGQRVASKVAAAGTTPPDLRAAIETSAREQ
jgi:hypothetical protein